MYKRACMENANGKYWGEMYDIINKYNKKHHTPLSKVNIRAEIDEIMREEELEANDVMVDTFSTQKKKSDDSKYIIDKEAN